MILVTYTDAMVFITSSNILEHGFEFDITSVTCSAAILLLTLLIVATFHFNILNNKINLGSELPLTSLSINS